jgi:hypothetical protein
MSPPSSLTRPRHLERAGELGERRRALDQRLLRIAQRRLRIALDDARGLGALVARLDRVFMGD